MLTEKETNPMESIIVYANIECSFHFFMLLFPCYREYRMAYGDINFVTNTTPTYYKPPVSSNAF